MVTYILDQKNPALDQVVGFFSYTSKSTSVCVPKKKMLKIYPPIEVVTHAHTNETFYLFVLPNTVFRWGLASESSAEASSFVFFIKKSQTVSSAFIMELLATATTDATPDHTASKVIDKVN